MAEQIAINNADPNNTLLDPTVTADQRTAALLVGTLSSGACTNVSNANTSNGRSESQDLSGGELPQAPTYSGSFSFHYERPINGNVDWFVGADVNFTDSYLLTGDLDPIDSQDSFVKVNVQAGLRGKNWDVMFFSRNINDERTATSGFDVPLAPGVHAIYAQEPQVFGGRVSYTFK